jgi:signal transduction histidine kinase
MVPPHLTELRVQLSHTATGLASATEELQKISRGIHPPILSKGGLRPALKMLVRRAAVPVELALGTDRRLPQPVEVGAYYVVSEALTNAAKHAQASVVHLDVEEEDSVLRVSIRDDGVGGADPSEGSGLIGLRDRVEALGGTMEITSPPGAAPRSTSASRSRVSRSRADRRPGRELRSGRRAVDPWSDAAHARHLVAHDVAVLAGRGERLVGPYVGLREPIEQIPGVRRGLDLGPGRA